MEALFRVFGHQVALVIATLHQEHRHDDLRDAVARFEGQGRVERVVTKQGRRIDCDFAVVGVGVEPVVDVVTGSGIETDNGILVDEHCRTTADKELVVRGSLERRDFLAFYLNDGRIDAVIALNRGKTSGAPCL